MSNFTFLNDDQFFADGSTDQPQLADQPANEASAPSVAHDHVNVHLNSPSHINNNGSSNPAEIPGMVSSLNDWEQQNIFHKPTPQADAAPKSSQPADVSDSFVFLDRPSAVGSAPAPSPAAPHVSSPPAPPQPQVPESAYSYNQQHVPSPYAPSIPPAASHAPLYPSMHEGEGQLPAAQQQQMKLQQLQQQQQQQRVSNHTIASLPPHVSAPAPAPAPSAAPHSVAAPPSAAAAPSAAPKSQIPVGEPVSRGTAEVICPYCSIVLRYPVGSELVRCGSCQSVSRIPQAQRPASAAAPYQQQQQQYPAHQQQQYQPQQPARPAQNSASRVQFRCSGCSIWLAADMSGSQGITRCPQCMTLMRPVLQMPQQQVSQPAQIPAAAPHVDLKPHELAEIRDSLLASGMTEHELQGKSNGWLKQQHDTIVAQQKELFKQAEAQRAARQPPQQQAAPRAAAAPLPPSVNPNYQQPYVYPNLSVAPLANQQMLSAGASFTGHGMAPAQAARQGDYSHASSGPYVPPARPQQPSVQMSSAPPISQPSRPYSDDAAFQASMESRLAALRVDEEGESTPSQYRPPKPRVAADDDRSKPLLLNPM